MDWVTQLSKKPIWLYRKPLDFRKQLDGLIHVVVTEMKQQPIDGGLYIFRNRKKDKLKLLVWDRNGFFMGYKRIEKSKFDFPIDETGAIKLTWSHLRMLISGMPIIGLGIGSKKPIHFV